MAARKQKLKVFALGGLNEIGKNITVIEYDSEIIVVDCGVAFPEDDMLGIDLVIPDVTYLAKNKDKVKGIFLTHAHEDHIGALPYILREINVPLYATKLTLGLIGLKLKEHNMLREVETNCVMAGETVKVGKFSIEFIHTSHSIADAVALSITTPVGVVIHSGDFKVDYSPIDGKIIDLQRFAEIGKKGVLLFLCESTNVERKGYTMSESSVGAVFGKIFEETPENRIMVATFSSNIHRVQQIVDASAKYGRKVALVGRSMVNATKCAHELGYLKIPENLLIEINEIKNYADKNITIITTGSQGEPMAALSRMASSEHKQVEVRPGDKIVISASPIPGNEKTISKVINALFKKGAEVIYETLMETHVSGHARQEELKLLHTLLKPKFFVPIHGEYRHLLQHKELAISIGMKKESAFVLGLGEVLELTSNSAKTTETVTTGQVLVDGLGVGDVGNIVLRDRKHLSQDGLMIVVVSMDREEGVVIAGPDIISRGFVYVRESEDLMEDARAVVRRVLENCERKNIVEWTYMKGLIKDNLKDFLWQKTKRSPMILPIIMEV